MNKQHLYQTLQAILEGKMDEAQAILKTSLEARFKSMIKEQSHINYSAWVEDAKKRGAKDFKRPSKYNVHAVDSDGKVVGTWQAKHGGFTHKPVEKVEKDNDND